MSQAIATAEHIPTEARDQPACRHCRPMGLGPRKSAGFLVVHRDHAGAGLRDRPRRCSACSNGASSHAVWTVPYGANRHRRHAVCQNAKGIGACWAVLADKYRLILFGRYPYDQQWRPAIVVLLFIGLYIVSAMRRFWRRELALIWVVTLAAVGVLMWGGIFGLQRSHRGRLGRPADHPDPGDLRRGVLVPAGGAGGARAAVDQAAGGENAVRAVRGADPRRAADLGAVHGQRDVPAVHAGRRQHGQAAACAGCLHPVRRRLSGRGGPRRPAGACRKVRPRLPTRWA